MVRILLRLAVQATQSFWSRPVERPLPKLAHLVWLNWL